MLSVWGLWLALAALAGGAGAAELAQALQGAAQFSVSSSMLLSDSDAGGGELGWRTQARLVLRAQPSEDGLLLHFTLESPQLMLRGKHRNAEFLPKPSLWDDLPTSSFLAMWKEGHITEAYFDSTDHPDVLDYKKALISLFQFQLEEGERNETDVSGFCHVHYEKVSDLVVRKSKMQCQWRGAEDEEGGVERRRVARVELAPGGALLALAADELLLLRGTDHLHALKARALHTLTRLEAAPAPAPASDGDLRAALSRQPALAPHALPLEPRDPEDDDADARAEPTEALRAHAAAAADDDAGSARAAAAALRVLPALRNAAPQQLRALLDHPDTPHLEGAVRLLGLAGTHAGWAAAREALQLRARTPPREALGRQYLAALALAPEVDEAVVREALQLGAGAGAGGAEAALARAALLAAAAAVHRVPEPAREALLADVKNALTRGLSKCKDAECSATWLLALGQLRRADLAELFLQHAERGARAEALAALAALAAGPPQGYFGRARRRLEAIALGHGAARGLDVRAAALQLALLSAADHPAALASLVGTLRARGPRELRRVCWQRLQQLAASHAELARLLPALDPRPADWLRSAYDGTSSVLERRAGWARLDSAQLASGGVLARGRVHLSAHTPREDRDLLTVELWTLGLESFATAPAPPPGAREPEDDAGDDDAEDVRGGLALTVAGVRLPDVTLFSGQGELLGHIWAGTGSEPTPALRALLAERGARRLLTLQAGVLLAAHAQRATALAMDAQAQVSLWGRTARAGLALRGGGAETAELRVRTAWGAVSARSSAALEPRFDISASLDFYARPQLCVHAELPAYTYSNTHALPLEPRDPEDDDADARAEPTEALRAHAAAAADDDAGSARAAAAALRVLPALRNAAPQQLRALLDHPDTPHLEGAVRLLGLAGTHAGWAAAREALQLRARTPPREALGRQYLAALALAPEVDEAVVREALQLGAGAGAGGAEAALARAALLAAAAAVHRVPEPAREALLADVKNALTRGLSKCKDAECSATWLLALGQLRRADLAELFLQHAERGARAEALAALAALAAGPPQGYFGRARRRLEAIALGHGAARGLDVRAAALQLALLSAADHPAALASLVGTLRARGPRELRRVCWQRLQQLAASHAELARLLPALDPRPADWLRSAYDGTSSVLERRAGWARLDSAQLASGGVLARGRVHLSAHTPREDRDLLTVELWTLGLESFATAPAPPPGAREPEDDAGDDDAEDVRGGLALTVAGVRLPDVTLFSGQGELLGHIWAGTGSEPTPALRALLAERGARRLLTLQAGVLLAAHAQRATALAMDAQAQVSLWGRTARAGLALRGGGAETAELRVRTAWGAVSARSSAALEPRFDISASLDFYARPQLCVHAELPAYTYSRNVTLESELGGTGLRVRRARTVLWAVPGRTLALGAPNDATCAALGAAHHD